MGANDRTFPHPLSCPSLLTEIVLLTIFGTQESLRSGGRFMRSSFSPTRQDVERYRSLRALSMALNHKIIKTIPRQAYDEIGDALGIRRHGVLEFDSEDMTSVMMDCCLYDWYENGKNLIQRYADTRNGREPRLAGLPPSEVSDTGATIRSAGCWPSLPGRPERRRVVLNGCCFEPKHSSRKCGTRHSDHTTGGALDDERRRLTDQFQAIYPGRPPSDRHGIR